MRCWLALASFTAASALRKGSKGNATAKGDFVALTGADCDQLQGLVVGGRELGEAAVLMCRFWPTERFGDFPVNDTQALAELFNGAGDLWKRIDELSKAKDTSFCWKRLGVREQLEDLNLLDIHGHLNATEVSKASDCDMQVFGKCYGGCPGGTKPVMLVGKFAPVCSSSCVQSTHQTPCGFGCATGVTRCVKTLMEQITVTLRSVGQVASYLSGNPHISAVVDQVLRLSEFFIDVVYKIVKVAKHVWKERPKSIAELGTLIALVQYVFEHAKTIGKDFLELGKMFGETIEMVLELVDGEFDWKEVNLKFVSDTILKHGTSILGAAGEFAEAFVYPKCKATGTPNRQYDCDGNGENDCRDWSYRGAKCHDNGGQCEYRYKFGDMLLDHSCRCKK